MNNKHGLRVTRIVRQWIVLRCDAEQRHVTETDPGDARIMAFTARVMHKKLTPEPSTETSAFTHIYMYTYLYCTYIYEFITHKTVDGIKHRPQINICAWGGDLIFPGRGRVSSGEGLGDQEEIYTHYLQYI